jgi:hypothetical protein
LSRSWKFSNPLFGFLGHGHPQQLCCGRSVECLPAFVDHDRALGTAAGVGELGLDVHPPCLVLVGVRQDQDDRCVAAPPVVEVGLSAGVLEARVGLVRERQPAGLTLYQQHEVEHRPITRVDKIDMTIDSMVDSTGVEEVAHLGHPLVDQRDPRLADQGLADDRFSSGHSSRLQLEPASPRWTIAAQRTMPLGSDSFAQSPGRRNDQVLIVQARA